MKGRVILIIIVGSILLASYLVLSKINQPTNINLSDNQKKYALQHVLGRPAVLSVTPDKEGNVTYKSSYMQFSYPARATIYNYRQAGYKGSSGLLDTFSIDIKVPRLIFSIEAFDKPVNVASVSDYPGARLRHDQPDLYKESKLSISGVDALVYTKDKEGAEKSGFLINGDRLYTISSTGTDPEEVNKLFDSITKTLVVY
ncbi:MAG TPA: hypothetical protein VG917_01520 [Patescibacteria group bacterium]|nr:hypothetical protein [Patescibacteria group bacterium]